MKPALYLLPVNLSEAPLTDVLPARNLLLAAEIKHFIVENIRTARRFLKRCNRDIDIDSLSFRELNRHTDPGEWSSYLDPLRRGESVGLMSEAGCPGIADPGADIVSIAQRENLHVVPLVGPSSILMSLMASGFNGQGFAFNGYLPIDADARVKKIRELEKLAWSKDTTQIFIETPYRNDQLLAALCSTLRDDTLLCIASDITDAEKENISTQSIGQWKSRRPLIGKSPAIFLIYHP